MGDKQKLLEAALFISPKPMMLDDIAKVLGVNSLGYVKELLEKLKHDYEKRSIELVNTAEGWQFQVKQEFLPQVASLTPYFNMPEGCKRTLALVAYKEPVKQSDIIKIQGNKAYSYIKTLLKMNLINIQKSSRTKIITLTQEFERYFGEERENVKRALDSEASKVQKRAEEQLSNEPKNGIESSEPKPKKPRKKLGIRKAAKPKKKLSSRKPVKIPAPVKEMQKSRPEPKKDNKNLEELVF